eukprot:COSAG01_NODE_1854_length_9053_cov_2.566499_2_plen_114_part_00
MDTTPGQVSYPALTAAGAAATAIALWDADSGRMSARWAVANMTSNHTAGGGGGGGPWLLSQTAIVEETGSMLLATIGELSVAGRGGCVCLGRGGSGWPISCRGAPPPPPPPGY